MTQIQNRPESEHQAWRRARLRQVSAPAGNIALVAYQPVSERQERLDGFPVLVRRDAETTGVLLTPTGPGAGLAPASGAVPRPLTEETAMARLAPDGGPLLVYGTRTADAFSLDGSDYEMRVYDSASPRLAAFRGIEVAPYDPAFVLTGCLRRYADAQRVPWEFTRVSDSGHLKAVPGVLELRIAGQDCRFTLFSDGSDSVLVFADATTGSESYAPGRFLRIPASQVQGDRVVVDFNYAIVPPCGFSDFYSCPIPPAENRVAAPVRAGEMRSVFAR
jgi:uncharacterized protein (DUF1684 family)